MRTVDASSRGQLTSAEDEQLRRMGRQYGPASRALELLPRAAGETLRPFVQMVDGAAKPAVDSLEFAAAPLQSSMIFNFSQISQEDLFAQLKKVDEMLQGLPTAMPVIQADGTVVGPWKIFRSPGLKTEFFTDSDHLVHLAISSHGGEELQAHIKELVEQGKTLAEIANDPKINAMGKLLKLNSRRLARKIAKRLGLRPAAFVDTWTVRLDPTQARARYLQESHMITTNYALPRADGTVVIYNGAAAKPSSVQTLVQGRASFGVARTVGGGKSLGHPYHTFSHSPGMQIPHASKHAHSPAHYGTAMSPGLTFERLREL